MVLSYYWFNFSTVPLQIPTDCHKVYCKLAPNINIIIINNIIVTVLQCSVTKLREEWQWTAGENVQIMKVAGKRWQAKKYHLNSQVMQVTTFADE